MLRVFAYLTIYFKMLKANYLDSLFKFANIILNQVVSYFYLYTIFNNIPSLINWTLNELVLTYGLFIFIKGIADFFTNNLYTLERKIKKGSLDFHLIKPFNVLLQILFEDLDLSQLINIFTGTILIFSVSRFFRYWYGLKIIYAMLLVVVGFLVVFAIKLITMSISFWTFSSYPVAIAFNNTSEFAKYPVDIYGVVLKKIFIYLIPFAFISYFEMRILLSNNINYLELFGGIAAALILLFLSLIIWKKGLKNYQSGGH